MADVEATASVVEADLLERLETDGAAADAELGSEVEGFALKNDEIVFIPFALLSDFLGAMILERLMVLGREQHSLLEFSTFSPETTLNDDHIF